MAGRRGRTLGKATQDLLIDFTYASRRVAWACGAVGSAAEGGSIAKSVNGGLTWKVKKSVRSKPGQIPAGGFYHVSSPTARYCYVGGNGSRLKGLWATSDGGSHWARRGLPADMMAFYFPAAATGWNVGQGGSIYRTANGGRSWTRQSSPTSLALHAVTFIDARFGWAVGADGAVVRTTDGGANWEWLDSWSSADLREVDFVDSQHGWARGWEYSDWDDARDVLLRTTDGGDTWMELP
jgi:photosystem II stability/assembly factor-like uncharacterized protein